MPTLRQRQLIEDIAANGRVEGDELELLRSEFYTDGKIGRQEADLLVELFKRIQRRTPAFEQFVYRAVKDHLLTDGKIKAPEAAWLRQLIFADGTVDERERKLLHELKGEAQELSPEFQKLYDECMKAPLPPRTSGGGRR